MAPLGVKVPVEAHIHANNWGFMAMVFSGLLIDLSPALWARPLATDKTLRTIFWLMTLGAAGLVFGPWFGSNAVLVPGLILHLAGMLWLLRLVIGPLWGQWRAWEPGIIHLTSAYIWILAPLAFAPFVILKASWIPGSRIEANAPQALIYGWVLQFGFALLPYLFRQIFTPDKPIKLGGSWVSVVAIHLGAVFLWLSIFISPVQNLLHGIAYLSWGVAMLPFAREILQISRDGLAYLEKKRLLTTT
jgi:cbb3-type cytochrome oxidase subunit 1